jgi:hypothetical protein
LRTKVVAGKSPLFIGVIILGYIFGLIHKLHDAFDWVAWLYILNLIVVSIDLILYYKYCDKRK